MQKQSLIEAEGTVDLCLPDRNFSVLLDNGITILAYLSGRTRRNRIRVLIGDRVVVELSPYDLKRGRIIYRHRSIRKT